MSERRRVTTQVGEANEALEELLGTLLADVPACGEISPSPAPASPSVLETPKEETASEEPPESFVEERVASSGPDGESSDDRTLNIVAPEPIKTHESSVGLPDWAQEDFKALLVCVGKLRFAVPLVCLTGIARLESSDDLTTIPGQPGWHRGVTRHRGEKLVVVDLGKLLGMPADRVESGYLLVIGEGRYGLACSTLAEQLTLSAGSVNWRQSSSTRDWQLGMLPEQMCVLLDLVAVIRRLEEAAGH